MAPPHRSSARILFLLPIVAATMTTIDRCVALATSAGLRRATNRPHHGSRPRSSPLLASSGRADPRGERSVDDPSVDCATDIADVRRRRFASSLLSAPFLSLGTLPPAADAATRDPKTGILLPSEGEIASSIPSTWDDGDNPLAGGDASSSFARLDASDDAIFYSEPRFVEHVDERAVESMTGYISDRVLRPGDAVLDLCSSWTSHVRPSPSLQLTRVAGLGMNAKELEANPILTERTVLDLNADPNVELPYEDGSFDVVLLQLSVDYLIHPLRVMKECARVLKKGGRIAVLFSNRLFLSKAVGLWTGSDDVDKAFTVGSYLHFCAGGFVDIRAEDLSTRKQRGKERVIVGDPLYVVTATKG